MPVPDSLYDLPETADEVLPPPPPPPTTDVIMINDGGVILSVWRATTIDLLDHAFGGELREVPLTPIWYPGMNANEPYSEPVEPDPEAPEVEPVPAEVSDRQFFQALALTGHITKAEALAAVKTGDLPAQFVSLLDELPEDVQFDVEMMLSGTTTYNRLHPATLTLASLAGWPPGATDDLFRFAATL